MKTEKHVDSILLVGAELPRILCEPAYEGIPITDTMEVHSSAIAEEMFRE